jgi:hypothetical protein
MDVAAEIKKALIELIGANPNLPITATVVSVQGDTCTIKLLSELVLSDVRLKATISDDTDSLLITPKIGSEVMVISQTGKLSGLVVIKIDSVEKIAYKKADFEFEVDGTTGKVTLKKQGANFGLLMDNFIDAIVGIQTINSDTTTGSLNPTSIAQLNQIKASFNLILNTV